MARLMGATALGIALCAQIVPSQLFARTVDPQSAASVAQPAEDAPSGDTDIIVTGSRVQRDGFKAPTPTTVLGMAQIAASSPNNIADVVNQLPALSTGFSPRAANIGSSNGTGGLNALNLRALGATRTLVLLDSRRVVGSNPSGNVNINTIPQQLVERVDIVTGGASAAYGSDAVTGVVNFVLNKKFNGFAIDVQGGITERGDGESGKIEATFGTGFADGRGHFEISGSLSNQAGVFSTDSRSWFNSTKLVGNPVAGGPARIFASDVNLSTATAGGLIIRDPANGALQGIQFGAGGVPTLFQFGAATGTSNLMIGGEKNDIAASVPLALQVNNRNVFGRLSYELSDKITIYGEGSFGSSRVFNPSVYQFKLGNLVIKADNAFLPETIRTAMANAGLSQVKFGTWNQDLGKLDVYNSLDTYRAVAGLDGTLGGGWTWNAYYQYGRTNLVNRVKNESITARYNQAIDAVFNAEGAIVCRDPSNGCVPLNIIGTGVASQPAKDWVLGTAIRHSKIEQQVAAASIQGEPFSTWAGPVSVAFGAEYRKESTHETSDALSLVNGYFSGNFKPTNGAYNVKEAFLETVIPLAQDVPFARSLELNGAVRATDYSTSGYVTTWKLGATWRPVNDLLFRAVRSRDIRAPNIADLFANAPITSTVTDPFNGGRADTVSAYLTSGNPNLVPEIASNLGLGVVYSPSWLPGFQASFDYYRIDIKGGITTLASSAQQAVDLCYQGTAIVCSYITRDNAGHITALRLAGINAGRILNAGFDIELSYRKDLSEWHDGLGNLTLRALINHVDKLTVDTGITKKDYAGEVANQTSPFGALAAFFPDLQATVSASYTQGPATINLTGRYIGQGVVDNSFTAASISRNRVSSVFYLDGSFAWKLRSLPGQPEFYVAVDNMLDRAPPVVSPLAANPFLNSGTSPGLYDTLGRAYRAGIRAKF